jgi:HK97 gp10 family phage protein
MGSFKPYSTLAQKGGAVLVNDIPEIQGDLKEVVGNALKAGAEEIAEIARRNAPVGGGRDPHPGRLRDSIEVIQVNEPGQVGYRVIAEAQADANGREGMPYAILVEFGSAHNLLAKPFLMPAFFEKEEQVVEDVYEALKEL